MDQNTVEMQYVNPALVNDDETSGKIADKEDVESNKSGDSSSLDESGSNKADDAAKLENDELEKNADQPVNEKKDETNEVRAGWSNKVEFFMAMLGSCVGLGSVWRFPYLCYQNGGGAFLLAYIIMVLVLGLPIFNLETTLGQFSNLSGISVWKLSPLFKGIGIGALITAFFITTYYNALIAQFMYYLILSMSDPLPWSNCYDWWGASPCCRECGANETGCVPTRNISDSYNCTKYNLPAEEFYNTYVLQISPSIDQFGTPVTALALCLLGCWTIVTLVLLRGATSFGKAAYFTALFPYVMLITILIQGAMLDGASKGVEYFIIPDWDRLLDPIVWSNAAGQVFYSLSTAYGQTIALASYNDFRHPLLRDGTIIVFMTLFTAILSGFVVFTILGYMAQQKGVELQDVVTSGPGLVFQVYPEALAQMPVSTLWAILFFLMMLTLGFGTQFSQVETIMLALQDEFAHLLKGSKRRKMILRILVPVFMFLVGLSLTCNGGMYLLNLIDQSSGTFSLLFLALAECIVIPWVYGWDRFAEDIRIMTGRRPWLYFIICWCLVLPVGLSAVLIMNFIYYAAPTYEGKPYPEWANALGIVITVLPMIAIPIWATYYYCWRMKGWVLAKEAAVPELGWGPSVKSNYVMYIEELPDKYKHFQTVETSVKAYSRKMLDEVHEPLINGGNKVSPI